jgi:hypothetical protein
LHVPHNYSRWSLSPIFFRSIKPPNQSWFQTQFYAMPFTVTVQTDLISFLWSKWPPNLWSSDLINLEGLDVKSSPAFRLTETRNCCISVLLSLLSWLWSIVTAMLVVLWLSQKRARRFSSRIHLQLPVLSLYVFNLKVLDVFFLSWICLYMFCCSTSMK